MIDAIHRLEAGTSHETNNYYYARLCWSWWSRFLDVVHPFLKSLPVKEDWRTISRERGHAKRRPSCQTTLRMILDANRSAIQESIISQSEHRRIMVRQLKCHEGIRNHSDRQCPARQPALGRPPNRSAKDPRGNQRRVRLELSCRSHRLSKVIDTRMVDQATECPSCLASSRTDISQFSPILSLRAVAPRRDQSRMVA